MSSLLSLSAPIETSRMASARVYGRSWLMLSIGLKMRSRKDFRVFGAPITRIDDIVVGNVELS